MDENEITTIKNIYISLGIDPETAEQWARENAKRVESERLSIDELLAFFDNYNNIGESILGCKLELHH